MAIKGVKHASRGGSGSGGGGNCELRRLLHLGSAAVEEKEVAVVAAGLDVLGVLAEVEAAHGPSVAAALSNGLVVLAAAVEVDEVVLRRHGHVLALRETSAHPKVESGEAVRRRTRDMVRARQEQGGNLQLWGVPTRARAGARSCFYFAAFAFSLFFFNFIFGVYFWPHRRARTCRR